MRPSTLDRPFAPPLREQEIQRAVFQHIKTRGAADAFAFHPANGGFRKPKEARIFAGLGVVPGVPDVICIKQGNVFALELKADAGKLSPKQQQVLDRLALCGAIVAVTHGLDAALACLERWGILKGAMR